MPATEPPQRIRDAFYEIRVAKGRGWSLRRFATEALGGAVDTVMLGCIERGQRFPTEALVRRLAAVAGRDPLPLLALLWRDRLVYAAGREIEKLLRSPKPLDDVEDADLAVIISQGIAALPEDGGTIPVATWRRALRRMPGRRAARVTDALARRAEAVLAERGLIRIRGGTVGRLGRHYVAQDVSERAALAMEFTALFFKGLIDELVLSDKDPHTYLRNHYLHIDRRALKRFQTRVDRFMKQMTRESAVPATDATEFLNVLVVSTPFGGGK
jgi:hypothetical protein